LFAEKILHAKRSMQKHACKKKQILGHNDSE